MLALRSSEKEHLTLLALSSAKKEQYSDGGAHQQYHPVCGERVDNTLKHIVHHRNCRCWIKHQHISLQLIPFVCELCAAANTVAFTSCATAWLLLSCAGGNVGTGSSENERKGSAGCAGGHECEGQHCVVQETVHIRQYVHS